MSRRLLPVLPALAVLALVSGCGGGGSGTSASAPQPSASATASAAGSGGGQRGAQFRQEFTKARQCLQAAGIAVPTLPPHPSFSQGSRPSFSPGSRPSYSPGARPSGRPFGGGQGGLGRVFANPQAQAALKACGITLPTFAPRAGAQPTGTAAP